MCPVCGRYEITYSSIELINDPKLQSFLFYNRFMDDSITEYRYHTTLSKEKCDEYKKDFEEGDITHGHPVHMDSDIIDNWYPKSFAERVDYIILYLSKRAKHIGQRVTLKVEELYGLLFIDRKEIDAFSRKMEPRQDFICLDEAGYMLNFLVEEGFITTDAKDGSIPSPVSILLTPKGYARVDALQKAVSCGSNALVAMKFGDETKPLREAIRKGIKDARYNAIFIDEVQHNDFITPELLKHIRDSKFVVVDLTHQNNGAYFEEGYAMGLGKPVIQLCKRHVQLHFDIAQKNTIIWDTEEDIPDRLTNRIKATID
ncbi:MAG: hypothetical protein IKH34_08580 [Oscillospiraceae bacterium]|nr:hypothetical protein [Oscillospiraceae bacterium]MBR3475103.1 hypothetical protein [Oscillospiraceae bacterium]